MAAKKTSQKTSHLRQGNPGNSGGKKGRSGRPKNSFIERCIKSLDKSGAVAWAQRVAAGKLQPKSIIIFGKVRHIETYPTVDERLECAKWLADRGHGKATQQVDPGEGWGELVQEIRNRYA